MFFMTTKKNKHRMSAWSRKRTLQLTWAVGCQYRQLEREPERPQTSIGFEGRARLFFLTSRLGKRSTLCHKNIDTFLCNGKCLNCNRADRVRRHLLS